MAFSIPRTLFEPEHEQFRDALRRFVVTEVLPHRERHEKQGFIDRDIWLKGAYLDSRTVNIALGSR